MADGRTIRPRIYNIENHPVRRRIQEQSAVFSVQDIETEVPAPIAWFIAHGGNLVRPRNAMAQSAPRAAENRISNPTRWDLGVVEKYGDCGKGGGRGTALTLQDPARLETPQADSTTDAPLSDPAAFLEKAALPSESLHLWS